MISRFDNFVEILNHKSITDVSIMHAQEKRKIKQKYISLGNTDVKRPVTKSQPETPRSSRQRLCSELQKVAHLIHKKHKC